MPRKNAMRDSVNSVRSKLPDLSDLPREKIELALLYYESNVDETVEAFKRNGAIEALAVWTEMSPTRENASAKRTYNNAYNNTNTNKQITLPIKLSLATPQSNGILRPSQRASNIFRTFAEGGIPTITSDGILTTSSILACSPSSISSSSLIEQSDHNVPLNSDNIHALSENCHVTNNEIINRKDMESSQDQNSLINPNDSISAITRTHESSINTSNQEMTKTITMTTNSSSSNPVMFANNRKLLTKSVKDLQRQSSTLTNVEISFNNEIASSMKLIDNIFKQIHEIIKEREVELYLEMDKVKEQGLNILKHQKQCVIGLRQRIDRCDHLESFEMENLRHDIKQFVTDRRYDLGEDLASIHRFEYDRTILESLKCFGHVLAIDYNRRRSTTSSNAFNETKSTSTEKLVGKIKSDNSQTSMISSQMLLPPNEIVSVSNQQEPLPQRIHGKPKWNNKNSKVPANDHASSNYPRSLPSSQQTYHRFQYHDDTNNYPSDNGRRVQQHKFQGSLRELCPILNYHNGNSRRI